MPTATRTPGTDWLWDLARVSAATLRRSPALTWIGLTVALGVAATSGPWLGLPLALTTGLLAGGMVRYRSSMLLWLTIAVVPLVIAYAPLEVWIPGRLPVLAWPEGRALLAVLGAVVGFVLTHRVDDVGPAPLVAALLAGAAAFAVFGYDAPPLVSRSGIAAAGALATALTCLAALSVRRGWVLAWCSLAGPAAVTGATWSDHWLGAVAAGALLVPWAARTGRALLEGTSDELAVGPGERLLVRLQTRPWGSSCVALGIGIALTRYSDLLLHQSVVSLNTFSRLGVDRAQGAVPTFEGLALILLFHASCTMRDYYARLAVWVAAALVPPLFLVPDLARLVVSRGASPLVILDWIEHWDALVVLGTGLLLGRRMQRAGLGFGGVALLAHLLVARSVFGPLGSGAIALFTWVAPVHYLVVRAGTRRPVLALAAVCGVGGGLAAADTLAEAAGSTVEAGALWLAALVTIRAAQRVRSLTAVPDDHPIVADWGLRA